MSAVLVTGSNRGITLPKEGKAMMSTKDVLDRYIMSFRAGDLAGILSRYAPDAVLFSPHGVAAGTRAIRLFFSTVLDEFGSLHASFQLEQQSIERNHGYIRWRTETVNDVPLLGCDTFAVLDGRIVVHSFTAKLAGSPELLDEASMARELAGEFRAGQAVCDIKAYATALEWAGAGGIR